MENLSNETVTAMLEGISKAEAGMTDKFKSATLSCIKNAAKDSEFISIDDVYPYIEKTPNFPYLSGKKMDALGPCMLTAKKLGWITKTDKYVRSDRPSTHGLAKRVWKSNLYASSINI